MIKIVTLKSGIKLIIDKMDSVKSISIGIFCGTGSANENEKEHGISHLIEHMLFKGTEKRDSFKIVQEMESYGAEYNAFTGKEMTCFYAKCIDEKKFNVAEILLDIVGSPLFDENELLREKSVVCEEINMNLDEPDTVAMEKFEELIFADTSISHSILGSKESVNSFDRSIINKYYLNHYTKDNIVISIAGNIDEKEIVDFFDDKLISLPDKKRIEFSESPKPNYGIISVEKPVEQANIVMGCLSLPYSDIRRYYLRVLSFLFGGGMSSRLFQTIREDKGLAYSVHSSNYFLKDTGAFAILAGVAKDRIDEYLDVVKNEILKLRDTSISSVEFETAIIQLKSSDLFAQESSLSRMVHNGKSYLLMGECKSQNELIDIYNKIKIDDIEEVKELITDLDKYTSVIVTEK